MSEVEQGQAEGGVVQDGPMPHEGAAPVEAPPREKRGYVVLVKEALEPIDEAAEAADGVVDPAGFWGELGVVEAFNRAGALEEVERRWPSALEGEPHLHLIPERFWSEITPEAAPPPPPRRRWKGV